MFTVGVGVTWLSYFFVPVKVSLCQLARHPDWYDGKLVRVEAAGSQYYGAVIISDDSCRADDAWAVVMLDESFQASPDLQVFLTDSRSETRKAQVLVTGRFNQNGTRGCYGPRFGIRGSDVELKSPVVFEPAVKREQ